MIAGLAVFWLMTQARPFSAEQIPDHEPNLRNGETLFWAGGCASCHAAAKSEGADRLKLVGGVELMTPFGTFRTPNISPDPVSGIGNWTNLDFINAMVKGLSPQGKHYYPAFPYTNYQKMPIQDLLDLNAFLNTLPAVTSNIPDHDLKFPFTIRRGLGLWKLLYLDGKTFKTNATASTKIERGRYLVQGPAHCGACHTPRNMFGGELTERFLAGAESFEIDSEGQDESSGFIPNITPHSDGIGSWSEQDIAYSLESGMNPDYDSFGGSMVEVQENMAMLSPEDRAAIAAYLKSVPAIESQ